MKEENITHLDCTLRDGGYYTKWDFPKHTIEDYLFAIKLAGIDVAELGFRFCENNGFKGACAYTTDEFLETLKIPKGLKIGFMINASDIISNTMLDRRNIEKLVPQVAKNSPASLVRIASHVHELEPALEACKWLSEKGYMTGINIMQISGCSQKKIEAIASKASQYPLDVLYFADSLGNANPEAITKIIRSLRQCWKGKLGIHAHDNLLMAFANSMQALEEGVSWVDSTITGMGRGAGNLRTEEFVLETIKFKSQPHNLLPLLKIVRTVFNPLKEKYRWGSNPFYYLSGKYSIHPTYIQEMLKDQQYDEKDILSVINYLKNIDGISFDFNTLNMAKNFYSTPCLGTWPPSEALKGKKILLLGSGETVEKHRDAIESYIKRERPIVLALNASSHIAQELIHYRVACHPVRLLADASKHLELPQPLIAPFKMLPETLQKNLSSKDARNFGIEIQSEHFEFKKTSCILPNLNVLAYALGIICSGRAESIFLAGFDGYSMGSTRNEEMNKIFHLFQGTSDISFFSVTPSVYKIPQKSIYAIEGEQ